MTIYDPWLIRRPGGGVVTFRILAAESVMWYPADEKSLKISGREVPLPWIGAAFVEYIDRADIRSWRDYSIPLTEDTVLLKTGDQLVVTLKDERHFKHNNVATP